MASLTSSREHRRYVIRILCSGVVLHVAARAVGAERSVVSVHVAVRAGHIYVRACQRELSRIVIECSRLPCCRRVTRLAGRRESRGYVVGVLRALVILQMASRTIGTDGRIVPANVTGRTRHIHVRARQWELCLAVIERRRLPRCRRVAHLAGCRYSRGSMVRVGRALVVLHVTTGAIGTDCRVVAADMTGRAGHAYVRSSERELRRVVIEIRRLPRRC